MYGTTRSSTPIRPGSVLSTDVSLRDGSSGHSLLAESEDYWRDSAAAQGLVSFVMRLSTHEPVGTIEVRSHLHSERRLPVLTLPLPRLSLFHRSLHRNRLCRARLT